jgi:hypothetical protein
MRRIGLAVAGIAALTLGSAVVADSSTDGQQTVTIAIIAPRELTVDQPAVTLAGVTYGFDHSDNGNPGVGFGRVIAGSSGLAFKAGPDGAAVTVELTRLEDVTDPATPVAVTWADVFGAAPDADFSLRLATNPSCSPRIDTACLAVAVASTLPTIQAATTPEVVTSPAALRVVGAQTTAPAAQLVGASSSIAPLGGGVTGTIGISFRYFGTAAFPDGGTAPRTIEVGLSYIISDF